MHSDRREQRILGLDPGETTGVAWIDKGKLTSLGTTPLWEGLDVVILCADVVIIEEFRLYGWMAKTKSWSTLPEAEVIGVAKYLANKHGKLVVLQGASHKAFYSDERLRHEGWLLPEDHPVIHARDALRHALYYLAFGQKEAPRARSS